MKMGKKYVPITMGEVLKLAREKISYKHNWLQFRMAENADKIYVDANSDDACYWCASGAVLSVFPQGKYESKGHKFETPLDEEMYNDTLEFLSRYTRCADVFVFNDRAETGHDDVIDLFDRAIAAYERDLQPRVEGNTD